MNEAQTVSLFTNAAMAGLACLWVFISLASWLRRRRPLHLAGAVFAAIACAIFFLRTLVFAEVFLWSAGIENIIIRWLWLAAVLVWLIYSIVYSIEHLRRPDV